MFRFAIEFHLLKEPKNLNLTGFKNCIFGSKVMAIKSGPSQIRGFFLVIKLLLLSKQPKMRWTILVKPGKRGRGQNNGK